MTRQFIFDSYTEKGWGWPWLGVGLKLFHHLRRQDPWQQVKLR